MKNIAEILVESQVVRINFEEKFQWTSGVQSPIYCDARELISLPKARTVVVNAFLEVLEKENISADFFAGTSTAGIPWAAFLAEKLQKPMLYVRGKPKGHGGGKMVEGRGKKKMKVVVIEDAFSTASSSLKTIEALQKEFDAEVVGVLGIFSWNTSLYQKNTKQSSVPFFPLTNFEAITQTLTDKQKITSDEKASLENFRQNL